jgi:YNFM family putative membrane transporter
VLLSLPASIATLVPALTLVIGADVRGRDLGATWGLRGGGPDRGMASAVYFTLYYVAGAAAGFLPGLGWQRWGWPGVASSAAIALAVGFAGLLAPGSTRESRAL